MAIGICGKCYKPLRRYRIPGRAEEVERCPEGHIDHRMPTLYPKLFKGIDVETIDWDDGCFMEASVK